MDTAFVARVVRIGSVAIKGRQYTQHSVVRGLCGLVQCQQSFGIKYIVVGGRIDRNRFVVGLLTKRCDQGWVGQGGNDALGRTKRTQYEGEEEEVQWIGHLSGGNHDCVTPCVTNEETVKKK